MKKVISRIMILAMLGTLLAGCGVVQTPPSTSSASSGSSTAGAEGGTSGPAQPLEGAATVLRMSHGDNDTSMLENTWNAYARTFKNSLKYIPAAK